MPQPPLPLSLSLVYPSHTLAWVVTGTFVSFVVSAVATAEGNLTALHCPSRRWSSLIAYELRALSLWVDSGLSKGALRGSGLKMKGASGLREVSGSKPAQEQSQCHRGLFSFLC